MGDDSSSDVAAAKLDDDEDPSVTAVAEEPSVTRERAPEVKPGDLLAGRYQIEAVLGKGGSGVVLRAYDRVSATVVAVKVLKPGLTHDPRWEKRFQRELRLGRPVRHPNVCRIFDIGDSDGYRFLTMEYATGGTLRDFIKKSQPLRPLQERLDDASGVIAGLAAIHGAGIVHRDVKPDNMLRMDDGRLVLSDFGLATDLPDSTMVSVFVGTPHYMAPEVREGDPATTRSDVWSLGVVLHEIFFGKRPEKRSGRSVSGVSKSHSAPTSSTVERAMFALCTKCLADDPADRPEDARAVGSLFERARRSPYAMLKRPRRRLLSMSALVVAAIATVVGFRVRSYRRSHVAVGERVSTIPRLDPTGEPADWTKVADTIATVPGHVHCFSMVDSKTARIVWGAPRRVDDIDMGARMRREAHLRPETFATGCPEISPRDGRILYVANSASGASQIMLGDSIDGRDAQVLTSGSEPLWLRGGEEFIYNIDSSHAAIFSLSMRTFRLLSDPGLGAQRIVLLEKAVSGSADSVALLFGTNEADRVLAIYEGRTLDHRANFSVPQGYQVQFDLHKENLLVSRQVSAKQSALCLLDWRAGVLRSLGRYPSLDLVNVRFSDHDAVLLGRRRSKDVWLSDGASRRRLTTDGENYSAALSATGDLLLSKRADDGTLAIWKQSTTGALSRMTEGPLDVGPDFSPDGRWWVYTDYANKSVMLCSVAARSCRSLRRDELLPAAARFSRDGRRVAYITQTSVGRLVVTSVADGSHEELGDAHFVCPPIWSSAELVWTVDGTEGHFFRTEWNVATGQRTGRRVPLASNPSLPDDVQCAPIGAGPDSPFFERLELKADESSTLLRLAWER